jgi:uncharacterized protein (TIGR02246 family)
VSANQTKTADEKRTGNETQTGNRTQTGDQAKTADEAAILQVLKGVYDAWDAHDADAFVADYTEDACAILPGSYRRSREEVRQSMAAGFGGPLKGSTTTNKMLGIRHLTDDTAVAVSETNILFPGETEAPAGRAAVATWVLVRRDGRWLLASYQNSPAVAAAR